MIRVMIVPQLQDFFRRLAHFPWRNTARVLYLRFREDRLGQTAGSLTFTTTIALVPFVTVILAAMTAFPLFNDLQVILQKRLVESLVPENISRQVLGYLTQFASKANRLGMVGVMALILSAIALTFTIDRSLNAIWRVRLRRPFGHKLLLYWAALTLGPLLVGLAMAVLTQINIMSRDLMPSVGNSLKLLNNALEFVLLAWGVSAMYRYVPYTQVKWTHAYIGGAWAALATELARNGLAYYFGMMPTYSVVYGAFATVPILLIWIYAVWAIVLLGAVLVANLPSLLSGIARDGRSVGWRFQLALEVLQSLSKALQGADHGLSLMQLCEQLRLDPLQLEEVLATLVDLDWIARLGETSHSVHQATRQSRYVLLADPDQTPLMPLMQRLLLVHSSESAGLWRRWQALLLRDVL